jgi:hypothetical protein
MTKRKVLFVLTKRAQWGLEPLRPSNDGLREVNFRVVELIM